MADQVLNVGQSLSSNIKFTYRDMGDGTHALVYAIGGTVVATIPVAGIDGALNVMIQDVIGNKLDTVAGNSLVSLVRQIMAGLIVPGADSALNVNWGDVIGNKLDTVAGNSLVSLIRQIMASLIVTGADSALNVDWGDVIGNKLDAASDAAGASIVALLREVVEETERIDEHFHNNERWWGAVQAPDEVNAIAATVTSDFVFPSGPNTWGAAVPILGTADDPTPNGQLLFDAHRVLFTDLDDDTSLWRFRIIYGYGTSADAILAGQWTEVPTIANAIPGNRAGGTASDVKMIVLPVGIKMWGQSWNDTDEEALKGQWGCHGYPAPDAPTPP